MKFIYYNANPLQRKVNDCTVRAYSLATNQSWDDAFIELSEFARYSGIMPDEVEYIDEFLEKRFKVVFRSDGIFKMTVEDFANEFNCGTYLITVGGHITCCIDGCVYDTFNPKDRFVRAAYRVK